MNNFFLVSNEYTDKKLKKAYEIRDYLLERNAKCSVKEPNGTSDISLDLKVEDVPEDCQCIIVLGGDGTFIRVVGKLSKLKIPVVGVNLGHLGYLCELNMNTVFPALDSFLKDDFSFEKRMMLRGKFGNLNHSIPAINDIVISKSDTISMVQLTVFVDGEELATYNGDGIIVATPTGSTGYNLSAGGPIVDPKADLILLTPVNDHDLYAKGIVLGPDSTIDIKMNQRRKDREEKAIINIDGARSGILTPGESIHIKKANSHIRIIKFRKSSFMEIMRNKMQNL